MALLALTHTRAEHGLYEAMLAETRSKESRAASFSTRRLMELTGLTSYSTVRRTLRGLLRKLSIESGENVPTPRSSGGATFRVYGPEEIFSRRLAAGRDPYPEDVGGFERRAAFTSVLKRVVGKSDLSRREAQVALLCTRGLTNAEIGRRLGVKEQTVKFHMRHALIKFGVRRRAELISHLLTQFELE
ncbi:MAG TPA: helix-turn-helix transcriptional regulator [Pyrinomonadaceae bacterium]|nr:helix-turn-helix transcriptional regulator [Pyrinomonadaceae bacterium]